MGCEPCGTRHDKGEQAEKRDVGSGIDDDQEGSSHGSMVPRAPGLGLRQPWKRAGNVYGQLPVVRTHVPRRSRTASRCGSGLALSTTSQALPTRRPVMNCVPLATCGRPGVL